MRDFPYLCHFRAIVHAWKIDKDEGDETFEIQTWANSEASTIYMRQCKI